MRETPIEVPIATPMEASQPTNPAVPPSDDPVGYMQRALQSVDAALDEDLKQFFSRKVLRDEPRR